MICISFYSFTFLPFYFYKVNAFSCYAVSLKTIFLLFITSMDDIRRKKRNFVKVKR